MTEDRSDYFIQPLDGVVVQPTPKNDSKKT